MPTRPVTAGRPGYPLRALTANGGQATIRAAAEQATTYQRTFPGRPGQVRQVRHDVARHLGKCPAADDAIMIVSELAANAVLHSDSNGEFFTVRVHLHADHARIE